VSNLTCPLTHRRSTGGRQMLHTRVDHDTIINFSFQGRTCVTPFAASDDHYVVTFSRTLSDDVVCLSVRLCISYGEKSHWYWHHRSVERLG